MAININGSGTITGISVGGLPDNIVTGADLADGSVTSAKLDSGFSFLPTGSVIAFGGSTAPTGYLECNGQSTTGYDALALLVGATVPDLRGEFVRGWDNGKGTDSGRSILTTQTDEVESHTHTIADAGAHTHSIQSVGNHAHEVFIFKTTGTGATKTIASTGSNNVSSGYQTSAGAGSHNHTMSGAGLHNHVAGTFGGTETRPRNIALMYIIKT